MNIFRYRFTFLFLLILGSALYLLQRDIEGKAFLTQNAYVDLEDGALIMREDYLGYYLSNEKIGYSRFILKEDDDENLPVQTTDSSYVFHSELRLQLQAQGIPIEVRVQQFGEVAEDLSLRGFRVILNTSGQRLNIQGTVEDDTLRVITKSEGAEGERKYDITPPIYHTDMIHLVLARDGLTIGKEKAFPVYDPMSMALDEIVTEVQAKETLVLPNGDKVEAYKVKLSFKGYNTHAWINKAGDVFKETSKVAGISFTAMRESSEHAQDMDYVSEEIKETIPEKQEIDLILASRIETETKLPNAANVKSMKVKLSGVEKGDLIVNDGYQTLVSDSADEKTLVLEIKRKDYEAITEGLDEQSPPYDMMSEELEPYLLTDPLIQSNHPKIKDKAIEITAGAKNAWEAGESIATWLYENIQKENRATIPSALEVLNSMKGDCNEHSTLFAALTRSIGIPTKFIAGLVYQGDGYYYHAWNEIYVDGEWLPLDSTLNRIKMDAAHIKLEQGSLDNLANINKLIGNLEVEILEYASE